MDVAHRYNSFEIYMPLYFFDSSVAIEVHENLPHIESQVHDLEMRERCSHYSSMCVCRRSIVSSIPAAAGPSYLILSRFATNLMGKEKIFGIHKCADSPFFLFAFHGEHL
jgi:hypothetical protein